ncbi:MAG: hypothetical protein AB7U66_18295, partial [Hyphomicrobiaceae bacterium]
MSKKSRSKRPRGPKQTPARKVAARKPASATPSGDLRPAHRHDAEAQKKRATLGMLAAFLFLAVGLVAYEGLRGRVMHWLSPPLTADATKLPPIAAAKPTPGSQGRAGAHPGRASAHPGEDRQAGFARP